MLAEEAAGSLFVAKPFENPFGSLLALYLVARIPDRGIVVTAAGQGQRRPADRPAHHHLRRNPPAALLPLQPRLPPGRHLAPGHPARLRHLHRQRRPHPLVGAQPGTLPQLANSKSPTASTAAPAPPAASRPSIPTRSPAPINNAAGAYSPFYVRLTRQDGEQEITHFSIKLPPGLVGKLAGIPYCPDAAIAQAKAREPRRRRRAKRKPIPPARRPPKSATPWSKPASARSSPRPPARSTSPAPTTAPRSRSSRSPPPRSAPSTSAPSSSARRFKVNPETGEVFVDATGSDPIPHIIDGIPTHLRDDPHLHGPPRIRPQPDQLRTDLDRLHRPRLRAQDFVSEADDDPVTVTTPFQAADCASLGFKPNLEAQPQGLDQARRHPAFKAALTTHGPAKPTSAAPRSPCPTRSSSTTPTSAPSAPGSQFAEGAIPGEKCPAASIYGHAKAITPILSEPLEGPVYLRSHRRTPALPDLVAALHNAEINIDLVGHVDGVHGGISNTFETVPDAPVTSFTLEMEGGTKGLLENSTNLCAKPNHASAVFTGQNGKVDDFNPLLEVKCPKKHKKHKRKSRRHHRGGRS